MLRQVCGGIGELNERWRTEKLHPVERGVHIGVAMVENGKAAGSPRVGNERVAITEETVVIGEEQVVDLVDGFDSCQGRHGRLCGD